MHKEAFFTYVEINEKKVRTVKIVKVELLRTRTVLGAGRVFTRFHEKDITHIRSHVDGEGSKLTKNMVDNDETFLYL